MNLKKWSALTAFSILNIRKLILFKSAYFSDIMVHWKGSCKSIPYTSNKKKFVEYDHYVSTVMIAQELSIVQKTIWHYSYKKQFDARDVCKLMQKTSWTKSTSANRCWIRTKSMHFWSNDYWQAKMVVVE